MGNELKVPKVVREGQAIITRHYFFLTKQEQAIVDQNIYTITCSVCKNKKIDRVTCHGCNGMGTQKALAITPDIQKIINRLEKEQ